MGVLKRGSHHVGKRLCRDLMFGTCLAQQQYEQQFFDEDGRQAIGPDEFRWRDLSEGSLPVESPW